MKSIYMMFFSLIMVINYNKHMLTMLLIFEFMMVSLFLMIIYNSSCYLTLIYFMMIMVTESCLGLSILVLMSNYYSNDFISTMDLMNF